VKCHLVSNVEEIVSHFLQIIDKWVMLICALRAHVKQPKIRNIPSRIHLGCPDGIGLGPGSVLLLEVLSLIISGVNLSELI
jgi:hypothetical protein